MSRRQIGHGWTLDLPDDFVTRPEEHDDTHHAFWSPCTGRTVYAVVYPTTGDEAAAALAQLAHDRAARPAERLDRREGSLTGEAWLLPESHPDGTPYWGLNTYTSHDNSVACVTFYFPSPADLEWAQSTWSTVLPTVASESSVA